MNNRYFSGMFEWSLYLLISSISILMFYQNYVMVGGDESYFTNPAGQLEYFLSIWNAAASTGGIDFNKLSLFPAVFFKIFLSLDLSLSTIQKLWFVFLSLIVILGFKKISNLYFKSSIIFVLVASLFYLYNIWGYIGEIRRLGSMEFSSGYYFAPLMLYFCFAYIKTNNLLKYVALLALFSVLTFSVRNVIVYSGYIIAPITISLFLYSIYKPKSIIRNIFFLLVYFALVALIHSPFMFVVMQYIKTIDFNAFSKEVLSSSYRQVVQIYALNIHSAYKINIINFIPIFIIFLFYFFIEPKYKKIYQLGLIAIILALFFMLGPNINTLNGILYNFLNQNTYLSLFRYPEMKLTTVYLLPISLLLGSIFYILAENKKISIFSKSIGFSLYILMIFYINPMALKNDWVSWIVDFDHTAWTKANEIQENSYFDSRSILFPSFYYGSARMGGECFSGNPKISQAKIECSAVLNGYADMFHFYPIIALDRHGSFSSYTSYFYQNFIYKHKLFNKDYLESIFRLLNIEFIFILKQVDYGYKPYEKFMNNVIQLIKYKYKNSLIYEDERMKIYKVTTKGMSKVYVPDNVVITTKGTESFGEFSNLFKENEKDFLVVFNSKIKLEQYDKGNIQVRYQKISNTKYKVEIKNATGKFPIIFGETFNEGWKIYLNNKLYSSQLYSDKKINKFVEFDYNFFETLFDKSIFEKTHFKANGFANAWIIDTAELKKKNYFFEQKINGKEDYISFELIIEFLPQKTYMGLLLLSIATITIIIFLVLGLYLQSKHSLFKAND